MNRFVVVAIIFLLIPITVFGSSVLRTGDSVSIAPDQVVEGDFYGMSDSVSVSGSVSEDLLIATGELTIDGNVGSDLAVLASQVDIYGIIGDDARIVAAEVVIRGEIKGDLVVVAKDLKVLSSAKIDGDILYFGSNADIAGEVVGNILGHYDSLRIDSEVGGAVDVTVGKLTLGDKSNIGAGVQYTSFSDIVRSQDSHVTGNIIKNDPILKENDSVAKSLIIPFLITLFATLVIYMFFRKFSQKVVLGVQTHTLRNIVIGISVLLVAPFVAFILIISTLGSLLGVILLCIYFALIVVSFVISGIVTGSFISRPLTTTGEVSIPFIALGVFSIHAFVYIPIIGFIILLAIVLMTMGSVSVQLYRLFRS